jgi:hypothetical protein
MASTDASVLRPMNYTALHNAAHCGTKELQQHCSAEPGCIWQRSCNGMKITYTCSTGSASYTKAVSVTMALITQIQPIRMPCRIHEAAIRAALRNVCLTSGHSSAATDIQHQQNRTQHQHTQFTLYLIYANGQGCDCCSCRACVCFESSSLTFV